MSGRINTQITRCTLLRQILPMIMIHRTTRQHLSSTRRSKRIKRRLLRGLYVCGNEVLQTTIIAAIQTMHIFKTRTLTNYMFIRRQIRTSQHCSRRRVKTARLLRITRITIPIKLQGSDRNMTHDLGYAAGRYNTGQKVVRMNINEGRGSISKVPSARFSFFLYDERPINRPMFFRYVLFSLLGDPRKSCYSFSTKTISSST